MNATARRTMCANLAAMLKAYKAPGETETLPKVLGLRSIEDSEPTAPTPDVVAVAYGGMSEGAEERCSVVLLVHYYCQRIEAGNEDKRIAEVLDKLCPAIKDDPSLTGVAVGILDYSEELGLFATEESLINGAEIRVTYDMHSSFFGKEGGDL